MTYKENFVAIVKCGGKILRERDGFVTLPFGTEYSLLFKNLDSRKALVKVSIDGVNVLENGLILAPNSDSEIEGFLEGNNVKNRFKFIQKTQEIMEHRGDRIDDGMIRVEFQHEKIVERKTVIYDHVHHDHYHYHPYWYPYYPPQTPFYWTCNNNEVVGDRYSSGESEIKTYCLNSVSLPLQDEGITVKGSESGQHFHYGSIGDLDNSSVIVIRLRGVKEMGQMVERPVCVGDKFTCKSCGRKFLSTAKFCNNCGTFLE